MTVTRAEGRSSLSRRARRQTWIGLAFLAPAFAFIVAFVAYPVITAAVLSFHQWDGVSARVFTGAANWVRLASDAVFWGSLGRNVLIAVVAVVFQVGLAMVIAYWLVRMVPRVKRVAMFLYVVPVVVSEICIGLLWGFVYNPYFGLLNGALRALGLDQLTRGWLGETGTAMPAVLEVMNFTYLGIYVLLFVAAFQNVDESVYEASAIDGAGNWRNFWHISVPMVAGDTRSTTLLAVVSSFKTFSLVFVLTRGGPNGATEVVSTYLFQAGYGNFESGYAATIGMAQLMLTAVVGVLVMGLAGRRRKGVDA